MFHLKSQYICRKLGVVLNNVVIGSDGWNTMFNFISGFRYKIKPFLGVNCNEVHQQVTRADLPLYYKCNRERLHYMSKASLTAITILFYSKK